jgi:inosose dehydratase
LKLAFSRPTSSEDESVLFQNYKTIGYDGLQLKRNQYAPYIDQPERFNEKWGQYEKAASALITHGPLDEENIKELRKLYKFAEKVGTELIVFCHSVPRTDVEEEDIIKYAAILSELGKEAKQSGLKLTLHHHYNQPVMHRKDFDLFFDHVQDQSVSLTVDTAHLVKSGIHDVAEIIQSFHQVIDNFHLKDFSNGDWKVLGEGSIDFAPIFKAIKVIHYDGWVSADEESGGTIIKGMEDCLSYIKQSF